MPISPAYRHPVWGAYVVVQGHKLTPRMWQIIQACARATGYGTVTIIQGGISTSVSASAATHAGLGVADIRTKWKTKKKVWAFSAALMRSGVVPFIRGFTSDSFQGRLLSNLEDGNEHIHAVEYPANQAHWSAEQQVTRFRKWGENGLANRRPYYGPRVPLGTWASSPYNPANIKPGKVKMRVTVDGLMGLTVDRKDTGIRRNKGYVITGTRIKRWGRWNLVTARGTWYAIKPEYGSKTRYLDYVKKK